MRNGMRNGFVKTITDSYHESICPYCKHENKKKSVITYGTDKVLCSTCGNLYKVLIDKEEFFRDLEPEGGENGRR